MLENVDLKDLAQNKIGIYHLFSMIEFWGWRKIFHIWILRLMEGLRHINISMND